jgi:hypothetical protein
MISKKYTIILALILLTGAAAYVAKAAGIVVFGGDYTRGSNDGLVLDIKLSPDNYTSATKRFEDASGLGNYGISTNAATFTADNYGNNNRAMSFNGTTDMVTRSTIALGTSATFAGWGYATSMSGNMMLWNHQANSYATYYDLFFSGGVISLNTGDSASNPFKDSNNVNIPTSIITLNKWYHYAVVVDAVANKATLYLNGEAVGTAVYKNPTSNTARVLYIAGPNSYHWQGAISQIKIYNRALSATEVRNLYQPRAAVSSLQAGLVGYWPLNGDNYNATTGRVNDKTPYGNNGVNHSAALTTDRMGKANGAMGFANAYIDVPSLYNTNFPQTAGSVALWIYGDFSTQDTKSIFDDYSDARRHVFIRTRAGNNGLQIVLQKPLVYVAQSYPVLENNKWSFVVVTYNTITDNMKVYVNGTQFSSAGMSDTSWVPDGQIVAFGGIGNRFTGSMSDVRVYNRELSATEISTLYGAYSPKIVSDSLQQGLVLDMPLTSAWTKTETAGSQIMTDKTPYGHDGQNNGATIASDGATFNGSSYIIFNNPINQPNLNQEWSVSAWVNINDADNQVLITNLNLGLHLNFSTTKKLLLQLNWGANDYYIYSNTTGLLANQGWKHVVFVFRNSDGLRKIYIDSVDKSGSGPNNTSIPSGISSQLRIGDGVNGKISNVKIYNRALSAVEIKSLYDKGR